VVLKLVERAEHIKNEGEKILKQASIPGQKDTKVLELAKQVRVIDPSIPLQDLKKKAKETLDEIDKRYSHFKTPESKADAVLHMNDDQLEALLLDRENADHFMVRLAEAVENGYLQRVRGQDMGDLNSTKLQRMIESWNMELEVYELDVHRRWDYSAMDRINPIQKRVAKRVMDGPRVSKLTSKIDIDMTAFTFSESRNTLEPKSLEVEPPTKNESPTEENASNNKIPVNQKVLEVIQNKTQQNENLFNSQNSRDTTKVPTTQGDSTIFKGPPQQPVYRDQIYQDKTKNESEKDKVTITTVKEALTTQASEGNNNQNITEIQALREEMKRIQEEKNGELHEMQKLLKKQSEDIYIMRRNQENANARARTAGTNRPPLQDLQIGTTGETSPMRPQHQSTPVQEDNRFHARLNVGKEDMNEVRDLFPQVDGIREVNREEQMLYNVPPPDIKRNQAFMDTRFDDNLRERYNEKLKQAYNRKEDLELGFAHADAQYWATGDETNRKLFQHMKDNYTAQLKRVRKEIEEIKAQLAEVIKVQSSIYPSLPMPRLGNGSKYSLDYKDIRSFVGLTHKIESNEDRLIFIWNRKNNMVNEGNGTRIISSTG